MGGSTDCFATVGGSANCFATVGGSAPATVSVTAFFGAGVDTTGGCGVCGCVETPFVVRRLLESDLLKRRVQVEPEGERSRNRVGAVLLRKVTAYFGGT